MKYVVRWHPTIGVGNPLIGLVFQVMERQTSVCTYAGVPVFKRRKWRSKRAEIKRWSLKETEIYTLKLSKCYISCLLNKQGNRKPRIRDKWFKGFHSLNTTDILSWAVLLHFPLPQYWILSSGLTHTKQVLYY